MRTSLNLTAAIVFFLFPTGSPLAVAPVRLNRIEVRHGGRDKDSLPHSGARTDGHSHAWLYADLSNVAAFDT